jgi:hypothetical protein
MRRAYSRGARLVSILVTLDLADPAHPKKWPS